MRRVTAVLPLAAAALALAGCSSPDDSADVAQSSAPATTSASAAAAPTSTAIAEENTADAATEERDRQPLTEVVPPATATATVTAAPTPTPAAEVDCSLATPQALLDAVRPTEIYTRMAEPVAFTNIRCAGPFAVGRSAPPDTQGADVLFRHENGRWVALDLGSAIDYARWGATPDEVSRLIR